MMVKWEELPVPVDEAAVKERAEVLEQQRLWRKGVRSRILGRILIAVAGLLALHGYIAFRLATDPVLVWGQEWMASDVYQELCIILIPFLFVASVAVVIGAVKNVKPERNKGLYSVGLLVIALAIFSPLLLLLLPVWLFSQALDISVYYYLAFYSAPILMGTFLVIWSFVREDYAGESRVGRSILATVLLYVTAAIATTIFAERANAFAGALVLALWLGASYASYLAYLAVKGCDAPWRSKSLPRADREGIYAATVFVALVLIIPIGLAGAQCTETDLEIISALPYHDDDVAVIVINHGGWPAEGEIVLYYDGNSTHMELARTDSIGGFGRWRALVPLNDTVHTGSSIVLHYQGVPRSWSFIGAGEEPCDVIYPIIFVALCAVVARTRRRR